MDFEILIDDTFLGLNPDSKLAPTGNKNILTLLNDYEDANWRYRKFQEFIWDNIAETALSKKERDSLAGNPYSVLIAAASNLRLTDTEDDVGKGSELAEIVLYGIMKHHYGALPVVPKIFYKQNSQDNAKGADSVHIVLVGENDFTLWFGEAKFFTSIENARLLEVIKSVRNSLDSGKLRKENAIITNVQDLNTLIENDVLRKKIKDALQTKKSIDELKPKIHIPILLLHECCHTCKAKLINDNYREEVIAWHKNRSEAFFKKQIKHLSEIVGYADVTFHLILFPVPKKSEVVDKFVRKVKAFKEI